MKKSAVFVVLMMYVWCSPCAFSASSQPEEPEEAAREISHETENAGEGIGENVAGVVEKVGDNISSAVKDTATVIRE